MIAVLQNLTRPAIYRPVQCKGRFVYKRIIIHHTADVVDADKDGLFGEELDRMHRTGQRKGYPPFTFGLGYHFLINPDGRVQVGDRWMRQLHGAHTKGYNFNSLGICMVGNFSKSYPTNGQFYSLEKLLAALEPRQVFPHRQFSATECCGKNIDDEYWAENFKPLYREAMA